MSSKHFKDLRHAYAKYMEYHGIGYALYNPVAAEDITPPCVGYFNDNGDWNLIANLTTDPSPEGLTGLAYQPRPVTQIDISWQPKTSLGVDAQVVETAVDTPSQLPGGAGLHVKYSSKYAFLGVLMTTNPVTQVAYNEERLFTSWLEENRATLYKKHGTQLKQFGLWLVTKTHAAPHCSINATANKSQDVTVSLSAKAHMLGEVSEDTSWADELYDKDWSHYNARTPGGLVVFIDGMYIKGWEWKLEPFRMRLPLSSEPERRAAASVPSYGKIDPIAVVSPPQIIINEDMKAVSPPWTAATAMHFPPVSEMQPVNTTPQSTQRRPSPSSQRGGSTPEFQDAQQELKALHRLSLDERVLASHLSVQPQKQPSPYPSVKQLQQQHTHDWLEALREASPPIKAVQQVENTQTSRQGLDNDVLKLGEAIAGVELEDQILRDVGANNSLARGPSLRRPRNSLPRSSPSPQAPRQEQEGGEQRTAVQVARASSSRSKSQSKSRSRSRSRPQPGPQVQSSKVLSLYLDSSENVVEVEKRTFRAASAAPRSPPAPPAQGIARSRSLSQSHHRIRTQPCQSEMKAKHAWHLAQLVQIQTPQSPRSLRRETRSISSTMSGSDAASDLSDLNISDIDAKDALWS